MSIDWHLFCWLLDAAESTVAKRATKAATVRRLRHRATATESGPVHGSATRSQENPLFAVPKVEQFSRVHVGTTGWPVELGPKGLDLADDIRAGVLRRRDDAHRRAQIRYGQVGRVFVLHGWHYVIVGNDMATVSLLTTIITHN